MVTSLNRRSLLWPKNVTNRLAQHPAQQSQKWNISVQAVKINIGKVKNVRAPDIKIQVAKIDAALNDAGVATRK